MRKQARRHQVIIKVMQKACFRGRLLNSHCTFKHKVLLYYSKWRDQANHGIQDFVSKPKKLGLLLQRFMQEQELSSYPNTLEALPVNICLVTKPTSLISGEWACVHCPLCNPSINIPWYFIQSWLNNTLSKYSRSVEVAHVEDCRWRDNEINCCCCRCNG